MLSKRPTPAWQAPAADELTRVSVGKANCGRGELLVGHHHRRRAIVNPGTGNDLLHRGSADRTAVALALNRDAATAF